MTDDNEIRDNIIAAVKDFGADFASTKQISDRAGLCMKADRVRLVLCQLVNDGIVENVDKRWRFVDPGKRSQELAKAPLYDLDSEQLGNLPSGTLVRFPKGKVVYTVLHAPCFFDCVALAYLSGSGEQRVQIALMSKEVLLLPRDRTPQRLPELPIREAPPGEQFAAVLRTLRHLVEMPGFDANTTRKVSQVSGLRLDTITDMLATMRTLGLVEKIDHEKHDLFQITKEGLVLCSDLDQQKS